MKTLGSKRGALQETQKALANAEAFKARPQGTPPTSSIEQKAYQAPRVNAISNRVDRYPQRRLLSAWTAASLAATGAALDQVTVGDYSPTVPTDPYVPALEHTVPQIMVSLREVEAWNELRVQERAGNDGVMHKISASASSGCCCGG